MTVSLAGRRTAFPTSVNGIARPGASVAASSSDDLPAEPGELPDRR